MDIERAAVNGRYGRVSESNTRGWDVPRPLRRYPMYYALDGKEAVCAGCNLFLDVLEPRCLVLQ